MQEGGLSLEAYKVLKVRRGPAGACFRLPALDVKGTSCQGQTNSRETTGQVAKHPAASTTNFFPCLSCRGG